MDDEALREISRSLGRLEEGMSRLRQDFTEEKQTAAVSRKGVYMMHDEFAEKLSELRQEHKIAAHITAQVREEVKGVNRSLEAFKSEAEPPLEEFKRLRNMGLGIVSLLALGGLSVGAVVALGIETVKSALRSWLG